MGFRDMLLEAIRNMGSDDEDEKPTFAELDTGYMHEIGPSTPSPKYDTYTFDGKGINFQDVDDPDEVEDPEGYWNWKMGGSDR